MNPFRGIAVWLDVRPHEVRNVTLSFLGAFLVISFLVLARSLREALYLTTFPIETLPYITAAVAVLSVPTVGIFARTLSRYPPAQVLNAVMAVLAAGLLALWPFATRLGPAIVAFYLWTALGTLLLTSGFWVVTAEYFAVRSAKRLFGLIGAGGTAGAMVTGNSLVWLTRHLELAWLIPGLVALLVLFFITQRLLPRLDETTTLEAEAPGSHWRESLGQVYRSPHLRTIALIVVAAGLATTLLDYQFKELARASLPAKEQLTSFFGAFYGWTGGIALLIQLVLVSRFLALAGVAWALAVVPLVLLFGSAGLFIAPGLVLVTAVRGGDNSFRKSLYRAALEILYVPVPSLMRRKTKTFIDSVVDSVAEGFGAALIFFWVTLFGLPSRYLSLYIIIFSLALLAFCRRMGRQYLATVTQRLQESGAPAEEYAAAARLQGRDLLSGTFTRLDILTLLGESAPPSEAAGAAEKVSAEPPARDIDAALAGLESPDLETVAATLERTRAWEAANIPALARLLARDPLIDRVAAAFNIAGDSAVPHLVQLLQDESTDFVVRRRIPQVLSQVGGVAADEALLDALTARRFEVRYRAALALVRRRRHGLPRSAREERSRVWQAIRSEVSQGRPVWEMQRLLDGEPDEHELISKRVGVRGELSLEHTFRLLSLILEPEVVRAAFHGTIVDDEKLRSYSLEYLEQVLPTDVRQKLWPFIGDVSAYQREKSLRSLDEVVSDLLTTGATLFGDVQDREALKRILEEQEE